jgi:hypothetical protein
MRPYVNLTSLCKQARREAWPCGFTAMGHMGASHAILSSRASIDSLLRLRRTDGILEATSGLRAGVSGTP